MLNKCVFWYVLRINLIYFDLNLEKTQKNPKMTDAKIKDLKSKISAEKAAIEKAETNLNGIRILLRRSTAAMRHANTLLRENNLAYEIELRNFKPGPNYKDPVLKKVESRKWACWSGKNMVF